MILSNSERRLISILMDNSTLYDIQYLSRELNLSNRSVYYNITSVSKKLIKENIEPPKNIRGQGYYLSSESQIKLKDKYNFHKKVGIDAKSRRNIIIFLMIIDSPLNSISKLSDVLDVSRNTILNDQKSIRKIMEEYGLNLEGNIKGHHITGNEIKIRDLIQKNFSMLNSVLDWMIESERDLVKEEAKSVINLKALITNWLRTVEESKYISFTEDGKNSLISYYSVVLMRILNEHVLRKDLTETSNLRHQKEFGWSKDLFAQLGLEDSKYVSEIFFLEKSLLGVQKDRLGTHVNYDIKNILIEVTQKVIENFKKLSGLYFKNEQQLSNDLYVHLISTFYRVKYKHQYTDNLVTEIKKDFFDVYTFTRLSLKPFEELNVAQLSENEISLIAIYFGAQIIYENNDKVLLVCSAGLGTSRLLKSQVESYFPEIRIKGPVTKNEYENNFMNLKYAVVITTIPLDTDGSNNIIRLSPIPTQNDISILRKLFIRKKVISSSRIENKFSAIMDIISDFTKINDYGKLSRGIKDILADNGGTNMGDNSKYKGTQRLDDLITKDTVKFEQNNVNDWRTAIESAAEPLLKSGNITMEYVHSMINNVEKNGPYINIGNMVALAHAKPSEGVKKLGLSLLHLNRPVNLLDENHPIKLIFVLAAIDQKSHVKAMAELAAILRDKGKLNQLIGAENYEQIENVLDDSKQNKANPK